MGNWTASFKNLGHKKGGYRKERNQCTNVRLQRNEASKLTVSPLRLQDRVVGFSGGHSLDRSKVLRIYGIRA